MGTQLQNLVHRDIILAILKQSLSGSEFTKLMIVLIIANNNRLFPIICSVSAIILCNLLMNNSTEAQLNQSTLETIANQTNIPSSAQLSVGENPRFIASLQAGRHADNVYVANSESGTVSVIDPTTNHVTATIPVGKIPSTITISYFGETIYVANSESGTVSVIDPTTNNVTATIPVGKWPISMAMSDTNNLYVANKDSNTVSVIDGTTNTVIKNITTVGFRPTSIYTDLSTNTLYVANLGSNTISVINGNTTTLIKNIIVGDGPSFIYSPSLLGNDDNIYVANSASNTVSVIDPDTNTVINNITVGNWPTSIALIHGNDSDIIYVANQFSNNVSVINGNTTTLIKNITVGGGPISIGVNIGNLYVANFESDTVSVIDPKTNTVIKNIIVGDGPSFVENFGDTVYVANSKSDTVSIINPYTGEVLAGVTFDVNPFSGGQIICNELDAPINLRFLVSSGTACVAKPNNGYEFARWVETFGGNSSRTINASTPTDSPLTTLREAISNDPATFLTRIVSAPASSNSSLALEAVRAVFTDDRAATLTVNKYGNFTAYFKALPPAVPAEYIASLFTVVVTAIVGSLLIPSAISWLRTKKQTSRLNSFHQQMAHVYADGKVDKDDTNQLDKLNKDISDSYAAGKITNEQYANLKYEVSTAFHELFKKRAESLIEQELETIDMRRDDVIKAYNNGKLNDEHYADLNNKISNAYQKIFKKRIESITNPSTEEVNKIKNDIEDAYSNRKITELDYNLLNGKISRILDKK